ncbi:S53 family peptidase [Amnibacterium sp. CER49]|uniref:S53 family peptidase n=1 Tax=Amnibacterium sp. CER49 TaxID=3039161 RepID=UPI0024480806|nr:S53 family peptidase [Amnibacterium sp. CER49]MDH2443525.1 S53 family peptidase [Amnibacterium sp. CER49]
MSRYRFGRSLALGVTALAMLVTAGPLAAQAAPGGSSGSHVHVCAAPKHGDAACNAIRNDAKPNATAAPSGYGPSDLRSAYNLTSTGSSTQTIAIVDAYDDPSAEQDLAVYRSTYGLPACTTGNGCFRKVNQSGGTKAPRANGGWAQEISLDLDMASAICPGCHILLVEASTASLTNLGTAVNTAVRLGATVVSNSYGGSESSSDTTYDESYFNHPGVAITVSSGDSGYGVQYPAASKYVTAVGGTSLNRASNARGWTETAWSGAGSGCSAYDAQPSWQTTVPATCGKRGVADVSAVADPNTGVAVYDSYVYQGVSGWLVFGGTSVAAPVIASVYALAGNAASVTYGSNPYSHTSSLYDVTSGSNGSCGGSALCTGTAGWDGPTGLGTPNGIGAF